MTIPKIYLETTMFSFYFAPDKPGYRVLKGQVHQVFERIKAGEYEPFTSLYTTSEIEDETNQENRERMEALISEYKIKLLPVTPDVTRLAALYIEAGAIPAGYPTDAAHIAVTTVNGLDFIVSLNFEHIARPWTVERVRRVNIQENYKGIGIYRPVEVLDL
ncbi:MAG: hypothetical protein LBG10_06460 [Treponema sp.]|jgi:hypothetical protein|nr:hypothetical protein [Treponema sp.]